MICMLYHILAMRHLCNVAHMHDIFVCAGLFDTLVFLAYTTGRKYAVKYVEDSSFYRTNSGMVGDRDLRGGMVP